jgi:uncharacterized membrane protein
MWLLVLAYPLLTHASVWLHEPLLQWLALTDLAAISLYDDLKRISIRTWIVLIALSAGLFALVRFGGGIYALFIQPIALPAALLTLFARSLRSGSQPMVTRFAQAIRGELPEELARYTRSVTILWCAAFALLTTSAVCLALFASHELWSVMTNFVHYLFLGAVFLMEYMYRVIRFRHLEHPGFFAYIRSLFTVRMRSL